ncbi:MAG: TrmH family RNA methyltransferase, partial [Nitrospiraceae bacterium]
EGTKSVQEILQTHETTPLAVVVTPTFLDKASPSLRQLLRASLCPAYVYRESLFEKLSDLQTAQGILTVVPQPTWDQEGVFQQPRLFGIFGERLQDPTNVGGIIRTAAALGVQALWLTPDSADIYNPKIVRATAGAILKLPVFQAEDPSQFVRRGCALLASEVVAQGAVPIQDIQELPRRAILAVGNESRGLSDATRKYATIHFHIPLRRGVESLNAAASTAIAAFYFIGLQLNRKQGAE